MRKRLHLGDSFVGFAISAGDRSTGVLLTVAGWILLGVILGAGMALAITFRKSRGNFGAQRDRTLISGLIKSHFQPTSLGDITISERRCPFRVRADVRRTIDRLFGTETSIFPICGVRKEYPHEGVELSACLISSEQNPAMSARRSTRKSMSAILNRSTA
jgi:hypothetical protein